MVILFSLGLRSRYDVVFVIIKFTRPAKQKCTVGEYSGQSVIYNNLLILSFEETEGFGYDPLVAHSALGSLCQIDTKAGHTELEL